MRWTVFLLAVIIASCSSYSREREQQSKIDSLANELKKRDSATKKDTSVQEKVKKDTVIIDESSDEPKEAEVKENVTKKKEQKSKSLDEERVYEGKRDDSVEDGNVNEEQENYASVDERNAVLKKVVTEAPTFKPQFLGGFKDIKFNFFNRYAYRLDQVILKVHYIREDGSEIKAETKILKDVAPNSTLTITAPDHATSGKKLKVTVDAVQCRAIDLCFYRSEPANPDSHRDLDPYRCR